MAKNASDTQLDAMLDIWKNSTIMVLCDSEPTTWSHISNDVGTGDGKRIGETVLAGTNFSANRNATVGPSGREFDVEGATDSLIDASANVSATGNHVALGTTVGTVYRGCTTCSSLVVSSGQQINFDDFTITVEDPA